MNRISIFFALMVVAFTLIGCGNASTEIDPLDEQRYAQMKLVPSSWTGEVVKCEMMEHGLYKVLAKRTGYKRLDTLLSTTNLTTGTKVQHVQIVTLDHNTLPQSTWLAVPAPVPAIK